MSRFQSTVSTVAALGTIAVTAVSAYKVYEQHQQNSLKQQVIIEDLKHQLKEKDSEPIKTIVEVPVQDPTPAQVVLPPSNTNPNPQPPSPEPPPVP